MVCGTHGELDSLTVSPPVSVFSDRVVGNIYHSVLLCAVKYICLFYSMNLLVPGPCASIRMGKFTRRNLMATSVAAALGASVTGVASAEHAEEVEESDTPGAPSVKGDLKRFSTTAFGAEVTGPFVFKDGGLLYSLQHPSEENPEPFNRAGVGYFSGFQFELNGDNDDFDELSTPQTEDEQGRVRAGNGEYVLLAQGREPINGGDERLGVTQTPDGTDIIREDAIDRIRGEQPFFRGTQYGLAASNPDCNQFVATDDEGTEGYLFTNWENSPGNVSRIPISQTDDGEWETDLNEAINLANTDALRELGGTRINCYGDLSPWNTMLSSEENYAHSRVSLTHTVSDIVKAGSGKGLIGGCQFWNRPNPSEIAEAITGYYDEPFEPQGYWALTGVEFLAYYLGAEPVDQADDNNNVLPIGDVYPNPYRYGYHVDYRNPAAEEPDPIKYHVMGRAAWEAPNIQADERTAYGCSDGDSKGIYKFVADEPIPSYDNPMDLEGTLYAPKITNDAASVADSGERNSPAQVPLNIEWIELGHASNTEAEEWIAAYDDITQKDYLAHAETDWEDDPQAALEEADKEVIENGNQNYITNDEIVEWAAQYEEHGPRGVDGDLRKVPFLETRAAAKEIGASIEFNKAEGVDSVDGAQPGDYVYFGISEFNDDMANGTGDIQMDRVDGGVVYRGELEADYNVSRLEPVIVGPDFTDPPADADDALRNVDNVYAMDDGRVLCCEDGFGGPARSYPNDGLYVYDPKEDGVDDDDKDFYDPPANDPLNVRFRDCCANTVSSQPENGIVNLNIVYGGFEEPYDVEITAPGLSEEQIDDITFDNEDDDTNDLGRTDIVGMDFSDVPAGEYKFTVSVGGEDATETVPLEVTES
jgi:secreted PhoX family phosphatase